MKKFLRKTRQALIAILVFIFAVSFSSPALAANLGFSINTQMTASDNHENLYYGNAQNSSYGNLMKLQLNGAGTDKFTVDRSGNITAAGDVVGNRLCIGGTCQGSWPGGGASAVPGAGTAGRTLYDNGAAWTADTNLYNNGGNIGIGTTGPTQKLTVAGNINKASSWIVGDATWGANTFEVHNNSWNGSANNNYGGIAGGHGYFYGGLQSGGGSGNEAGTDQLYVAGTSMLMGNVGIGTTNPINKLDVRGYIDADVLNSYNSGDPLELQYNIAGDVIVHGADSNLQVQGTGTSNFSGGVTIGSTLNMLVNDISRVNAIHFESSALGDNGDATYFVRADDTGDRTKLRLNLGDEPTSDFQIGYYYWNDGIWRTAVGFDGYGNGSFGGSVSIGGLSFNQDGAYLRSYSSGNSSGGYEVLRNDGNRWGYFYGDATGVGVLNGAGGWAMLSRGSVNGVNSGISLFTNGLERLTIDNDGGVGIGTTVICPMCTKMQVEAAAGQADAITAVGHLYGIQASSNQSGGAAFQGWGGNGGRGVEASSDTGYDFYGSGPQTYFAGRVGVGTDAVCEVCTKMQVEAGSAADAITAIGNLYGIQSSASSGSGAGVQGSASGANGHGIEGSATGAGGIGIYGSGSSYAGYFNGAVMLGSTDGDQMIKFTNGWTGYPDSSNGSEISNDTGSYKSLMIAGNKSAGGSRQVSVWDRLNIRTGNQSDYNLYVNGSAYSTGGWSGSDIRWKKNVEPLKDSLQKITALQGVNYQWKTDEYPDKSFEKGLQAGLIAQDVEKVIPELVKTDGDGYKAVSYEKISAYLIESIKELKKQNDELKARVDQLEKAK